MEVILSILGILWNVYHIIKWKDEQNYKKLNKRYENENIISVFY